MNKNRKPATGEARVATPALSFPSLLASLHKLVEQQCTQLVYSVCIYLDKLVEQHASANAPLWGKWIHILWSDFLLRFLMIASRKVVSSFSCNSPNPYWHDINLKSILEQINKICYIQIVSIFFRLYKDKAHKERDGHYMSHRTKAWVVSFALIWKRKCCNWNSDICEEFTKCSGRKSLINLVGKKWKWLWSLYMKPKQSETSMIRN